MDENYNLCMGCMRPINPDALICPNCAYDQNTIQHSPFLPTRSLLVGKYIVGKVLTSSPESAEYIGLDIAENNIVRIHEFLPQKLLTRPTGTAEISVRPECERLYYECLGSFESLWKNLRSLGNYPALDSVYDIFYLNNTAYAVCEYVECITLEDFFAQRQRLLSWNKTFAAFKPILYALSAIHRAGIIHANLSPSTILVAPNGRLRLSSFTIPHAHGDVLEISPNPASGFAPIERYNDYASLSPATDVYSAAALIYTTITGLKIPDSQARASGSDFAIPPAIEGKMPLEAVEALKFALQVYPSARMSSADELFNSLSNADKIFSSAAKTKAQNLQPPEDEEQTVLLPPEDEAPDIAEEKDTSSALSIFFKSFFCAVIAIAIIFTTLYITALYKYIEVPFLDSAFSSLSFLPINTESTAASTTVPETSSETQPTTAAPVTVVDFSVLSYESVKNNEVFQENFDLTFEFEYSETYEKNRIISQSIPAGQVVEKGTSLTLVISRGKPIVVLKDVVGEDFTDAYNELTAAGFVVEKIVTMNDGTHKENEVYEMSLVPGLNFEKGTEVTLSVWGKP